MIQAHSNHTSYSVSEVLGLAARENNSKRGYLLVNRLQAKHVPAAPGKTLALFEALGQRVYPELAGRRTVFIGFAETATAIGAHLAVCCPGNAYLLQTTRENVDSRFAVVDFREEHSHATQQLLFCQDFSMLEKAESIVFVEDELTTGKTILNFVEALEHRGLHSKFTVASLVNSMGKEHLAEFAHRNIAVHYLLGLHNNFAGLTLEGDFVPPPQALDDPGAPSPLSRIVGMLNPRLGVEAGAYKSACRELARQALGLVPPTGRTLVLGTEECMYPAICCAKAIEEQGGEVWVHATTRSPILVGSRENPLQNRMALESLYEAGRNTYLYNLDCYDSVLVVTDAQPISGKGLRQLMAALRLHGNNNIHILNWVNT